MYTEDEVHNLGDTRHRFVQWPRDAIKLKNKETARLDDDVTEQSTPSTRIPGMDVDHTCITSNCYHPQFVDNNDSPFHIDDVGNLNVPFGDSFVDLLGNSLNSKGNDTIIRGFSGFANSGENSLNSKGNDTTIRGFSGFANLVGGFVNSVENIDSGKYIEPDLQRDLALIREEDMPILQKIRDKIGDQLFLGVSSPPTMYHQEVEITVPLIELLQLFPREWLDINVLQLFSRYFLWRPSLDALSLIPTSPKN